MTPNTTVLLNVRQRINEIRADVEKHAGAMSRYYRQNEHYLSSSALSQLKADENELTELTELLTGITTFCDLNTGVNNIDKINVIAHHLQKNPDMISKVDLFLQNVNHNVSGTADTIPTDDDF